MRIEVEYFGILREHAGRQREPLTVAEGCRVREVLHTIVALHPSMHAWLLMDGQPSPSLLIAVDDQQVPMATVLHDGARVVLLPPISGGQ